MAALASCHPTSASAPAARRRTVCKGSAQITAGRLFKTAAQAKVPEPVISRTRLLQVVIARFDKLELVLAGGALARGHQSIPQALARQDPAHDRQRAVNLQVVQE